MIQGNLLTLAWLESQILYSNLISDCIVYVVYGFAEMPFRLTTRRSRSIHAVLARRGEAEMGNGFISSPILDEVNTSVSILKRHYCRQT